MRRALPLLLIVLTACGDSPVHDDAADTGIGPDRDASSDANSDVETDVETDVGSDAAADTGVVDIPADAEADTTAPVSAFVDPDCIDGQYREILPTAGADIDELIAGYDSSEYRAFIADVLAARYSVGAYLVSGALENAPMDCIDFFVRDTASAADIIGQLSTVVHECGHFWNVAEGGLSESTYIFTPDLRLTCSSGGATTQGGFTFARSLLNGDDYSALRPPCGGGFGRGCDFYADLYLDGDPLDDNLDGGDQGFNTVMEEATQYVNSLATGYAFNDQYEGSVSERDAMLTFLWWIERYLRLARTDFPDAHAQLLADPCWREAILTVWGRAWLYLEATEGMGQLGIEDSAIMTLVADPDLLGEIQLVRQAEGCE